MTIALAAGFATVARPGNPAVAAAPALTLWDSGKPLTHTVSLDRREDWTPVPRDLLELERDPAKARSDPGYYGRGYSFRGDAIVENPSMTAVISSARGEVILYARAYPAPSESVSAGSPAPWREGVAIAPRQLDRRSSRITQCRILQNAWDQVILEVGFSVPNAPEGTVRFAFDTSEIVEIQPDENTQGLSLLGPVEYGVVPSLIADDLILSAADAAAAGPLSIPSEGLLLGLLPGEDRMLAVSWPPGKPRVTLGVGSGAPGDRRIESIDFDPGIASVCVVALAAPGIWHREPLKPSFLEKTVTSAWRRPFPAKWKTQLIEGDTLTSFALRSARGSIWRGVVGSFEYPVWFDGDHAVFHLSKRVPPKGDSLIYFVEGDETPPSILTPMDMVKATLGRAFYHAQFDPAGRALRTHHRRGELGVRRACTCGCTEAIQKLFAAGSEVSGRDDVCAAVDDMVYFVQRHVARIDEYQRFARDLLAWLDSRVREAPALKPYLDDLSVIARQIPQECEVQKDNMRSLAYADQLAQKTRALTATQATNNLAAYQELSEAWRAMGGAQDYVLARCHTIARRLFHAAGSGCVNQPAAVELAQAVRRRCQQVLSNPDGYEIWPDY